MHLVDLIIHLVRVGVDIVNEMDRQLDQKIEKRRFFQDIQNSFQWATGIGLKPPQKNFRKRISTNTVARAVPSLGRNGPQLAA